MNDLSLLSYIFQQSLPIESVSGIVVFAVIVICFCLKSKFVSWEKKCVEEGWRKWDILRFKEEIFGVWLEVWLLREWQVTGDVWAKDYLLATFEPSQLTVSICRLILCFGHWCMLRTLTYFLGERYLYEWSPVWLVWMQPDNIICWQFEVHLTSAIISGMVVYSNHYRLNSNELRLRYIRKLWIQKYVLLEKRNITWTRHLLLNLGIF